MRTYQHTREKSTTKNNRGRKERKDCSPRRKVRKGARKKLVERGGERESLPQSFQETEEEGTLNEDLSDRSEQSTIALRKCAEGLESKTGS